MNVNDACPECNHLGCLCFCHVCGRANGLPPGFFYKPKDQQLVTAFLCPALEGQGIVDPMLSKYVHSVDFYQATADNLGMFLFIFTFCLSFCLGLLINFFDS